MSTSNDQALLDELKSARASGIRKITLNGQTIEYKSDQEMASAIASLESKCRVSSGKGYGIRSNPSFDRGF